MSTIALGTPFVQGLQQLSTFDARIISKIWEVVVQSPMDIKQGRIDEIVEFQTIERVTLQLLLASASTFVLEAVRVDATEESIRHSLEEFGFVDNSLERTLRQLNDLSSVIDEIHRVGSYYASIVDIKWRLDYRVRSSVSGNVHEPIYFLDIVSKSIDGCIHHKPMSCTVEQLTELLRKIREGKKEIENAINALQQ